MSRMNLFRKHGVPQAVLSNGLGRYIPQCQRITLKFCKSSGSSLGMRSFIENDVIEFAKNNPSVVLYLKPRRHRGPVIVAEYLNGERKWIPVNQKTREEINKWLHLLVTESGQPEKTLIQWWNTQHPSIQGPWSPFYNKNPELNVVKFPSKEFGQPPNLEKSATEQLLEYYKNQKMEEAKSESS
ncbi:UNVERIFIED_CONTAM: hypothetical protein PYX00_007259 [Menopon gallinae]|uniref:Large ribosomal subunit protein mL43 n=1 Tax=Menopon gallinae TaxID=328185 RepID=A0AAW2HID9_9NEOP